MKRLFAILIMMILLIPLMAQPPKVDTRRDKKDGYKEYIIKMETGGSIKQSDYINSLELTFYYRRYFSGYGNKGQMYFINKGYDNCLEIKDNKKTITLQLLVDGDTIMFIPSYWSVNFWSVNGVISERPDRYFISSFYDIYDTDIQRLLNAQSAIDIIKYGTYENFGWYLSGKNLDDIEYLIKYANEDPKFPK